jgi:hypothetical protein
VGWPDAGRAAAVVTGQRFPKAVIGPWAAYVIVKEVGSQLERLGRELAARPTTEEMGREVLDAVEELRWIGQFRLAAHRASADDGNAAIPPRVVGAVSEGPPNSGLTSGEVATMFGVQRRQATNLAEQNGGPRVATRVGRSLLFDPASVQLELERRSAS